MLERHTGASAALHSAERTLLAEQVAVLEAALEPGFTRVTWRSLNIPGFVVAVNNVSRGRSVMYHLYGKRSRASRQTPASCGGACRRWTTLRRW